MKIRSRRLIDFAIQAVLLVILVVPSLARVGIQCPFPLLTQSGSYNQNNPEISTDSNCRNVFTHQDERIVGEMEVRHIGQRSRFF